MLRQPPRSTRTDTLFPDTTLFRSCRLLLRDVIDHDVNRAADIAACDRPDVKIMGTLHARDRADRPAHLIQGHATRHALQQDVRRIAPHNPGPREHPKADTDRDARPDPGHTGEANAYSPGNTAQSR